MQLPIDQLHNALAELLKMRSDRAVAILGGAMLDDALTTAFVSKWRDDGSPQTKKAREMFIRDGGGPLTFGLMIDLAYLTHLVGPKTHNDLVTLKNIRNKFAHRIVMKNTKHVHESVTFRHHTIKQWCSNLNFVATHIAVTTASKKRLVRKTPKQKFLLAVIVYSSAFLLYAGNPSKLKKVVDDILQN